MNHAREELRRRELFESAPINKALLTLAIPTVISQLINLIYNVVDTVFIGMTGDAYKTAGVTAAFPVFMLTVSFSNLFGLGGGSLMARLAGRGENAKARSVSAFSVYGSLVTALLYSVLILAFDEPILRFLGASENTLPFARQYIFFVVTLGNVPFIVSAAVAHLLRTNGFPEQASIGLSAGGILNIILDPIFMFVLMPKGMEVYGAALATLLSNCAAFVYLVVIFQRMSGRSQLSLNFRELRRIGKEELREIFSVGVPSALLTALFDLGNIVLNILMAAHGDLQLAAIGIVMKAERVPNAVNIGLCQAMLPLVAYNYGAGQHKRMHAAIRATRIYGLSISVASILLFQILAAPICELFMIGRQSSSALATIAFATVFLRIRSFASPFQFLNYSTSYSMQAVGYGRGTFLHACFRELVCYIPLMYLMDALMGENGLASALAFGEFFGMAFALYLFERKKRGGFTF